MITLLKNGNILTSDGFRQSDLLVQNGKVFVFDTGRQLADVTPDRTINCKGKFILPGLADVHVHFREPGFSYKETIRTGSLAGARGGYSCVCPMPNLKPVPADLDSLRVQTDIIDRDACIRVIPYGTITRNQDGRSSLSDMEAMSAHVCAFSDDGKGIQAGELMEEAMITAKSLNKIIVAHCEDESLLGGTSIHDGRLARAVGHRGISSESEWRQVERDCELAAKTGCSYHVCHVSTKETVNIIRQAKASGIDVSCETGPHYLVLCEEDLMAAASRTGLKLHGDSEKVQLPAEGCSPASPIPEGIVIDGRFKMNPPLRSAEDRDALLEGLADGTVDMISTDHAPHSVEEKSRGLLDSAFGIVGLETAFPVLYTKLVEDAKILTLEQLVDRMAMAPRRRFHLPGGYLEDGQIADITVLSTDRQFTIRPSEFQGMGRATPFEGWQVRGQADLTMVDGKIVWENRESI